MIKLLQDIASAVENGDSAAVKELVRRALGSSVPPDRVLNSGLVLGMNTIGQKFKKNEVFIPEVLISTRAMNAGLEILRPALTQTGFRFKGKVVLATVKGDLHDIGKKIVGMLLEGAGYEVLDIGVDISKDRLLSSAKKDHPDVVGLSALLTTTMTYMREVIEALESARLRKKVKVIIGGAPVTKSYAEEIKADGYAPDAVSAVGLVGSLLR
jgi:5-methyltetrahydrofolate--homocysteine methyltransferase